MDSCLTITVQNVFQNQGKRISGSLDFKIFRRSMPPEPPRRMVPKAPSSGTAAQIPAYQVHNTGCKNY